MKKQLQNLWADLTADKKRATALGVLLLVALVFGVRALLITGGGPRPASAATSRSATPAKAGAAAPTRTLSLADFRAPERRAENSLPTRDLFADVGWEGAMSSPGQGGAKSVGGLADNDESASSPEASIARLERDAAALRLRSTVLGATPVAVIETQEGGRRRSVPTALGGTVNGFLIVEVRARSVVLEKEGHRVTLEQRSP